MTDLKFGPDRITPGDPRYAPYHTVVYDVKPAENVNGWPWGVITRLGPIYGCASEKAAKRWVRNRDKWLERGRPWPFKSQYLDHVEGQLFFTEEQSPYGTKLG